MQNSIITRLGVAPSKPDFQIGAYRTLLLSYLLARSEKEGVCLLRLDDTNQVKHDRTNSSSLFNILINEMGLQFDVTPFDSVDKRKLLATDIKANALNYSQFDESLSLVQSEKFQLYRHFADKLIQSGICCYDDTGALLFDIEAYKNIYGNSHLDSAGALPSAFPIITPQGRVLFHLASVVDEYLWNVTHVIRGIDLRPSEAFQEMLREALELPEVNYIYAPMLKAPNSSVRPLFMNMLSMGIPAEAIVSYMISSVYSDPNEIYLSLDDAASTFDIKKVRHSDSQFDLDRLKNISRRILNSPKFDLMRLSAAVRKYVSLREGLSLIGEILDEIEIQSFILKERRGPEEMSGILLGMLNNDFLTLKVEETADSNLVKRQLAALDQIIIVLEETECDTCDEIAQHLPNMDKKMIYQMVRWLILGREDGPTPDLLIQYLKRVGRLPLKLASAKEYLKLLSATYNES